MARRPAADTEPAASLWPESTRPGDLSQLPSAWPSEAPAPAVFDVCHVGVVLRALLLVQGAVMVGGLFVVRGGSEVWLRLAQNVAVALPGVLAWLLLTCALRRVWARHAKWAGAGVVALGALCGALGWAMGRASGVAEAAWTVGLGCAATGAALALVMVLWLQWRAQAWQPAQASARLAELQSRIRPHFLFNTLNTALSLVRADPVRAEGVLEDLAELFRAALNEDSGASVSLAAEVELAQRYLAIEQIRFGERLHVSWELDPAADAARLPPLLLQPLVENAVRHGVEPAELGGQLRIRTRVKNGHAVITLTNSVPDTPSQPGNGMALRNVRERLRLMHDVASQFEVSQAPGVYRVQMVVPL
jgi:two-component system sensor histidine kinase AlgZ